MKAEKQKKVLELGAGNGLTGILISKQNCEYVVITDGDDKVLPLISQNIQINECQQKAFATKLFWGQNIVPLSQLNPNLAQKPQFDCIIASDVVYEEVCLEPFWISVDTYLSHEYSFNFDCLI